MHGPRRVDAHELQQYGVSRRLPPSVPFTLTEQGADLIPERPRREPEVDEPRSRNLGLPDERGVQGLHQILSDLPRIPTQYLRVGEGNVGREVAVRGIVWPLDMDAVKLDPVSFLDSLTHGARQTLLEAHCSPPRSSSRSRRFSSAIRRVSSLSYSKRTSKTSPAETSSGSNSRGTSKVVRPSGYGKSTAQPLSSNLSICTRIYVYVSTLPSAACQHSQASPSLFSTSATLACAEI